MKEKILRLRGEGKTYLEISKELSCAKSTVSYYCGEGQKEKCSIRQRKNRKGKVAIAKNKVGHFIRNKIKQFKERSDGGRYGKCNSSFSYDKAILKIFESDKCYLTGRKLNLEDRKSYSLDHVTPVSKGGKNDLNNMGVCCRDANFAKTDMLLEEFIQLCKEVCMNFGYKVEK